MVDLRPDQLATVLAILQAKVPECEVWAFGSRAKWTAKDKSDLDLALVSSERIPLSKLGRLREAFTDSYLPMSVDVVDIHRVSDEFRRIIESQKVVLQKASASPTADTDRSKWQTLPLEACLETIIDYRGKTPTKVSKGIPLITAKVVKNGRIETPDEFIAEEDYEGWMRRGFPQAGDVLLTMEAPLGEVAQLDDRKVALAQRLVALRGKRDLLDNWYLKYLLQSDLVQDQLRARATGTTVLGIKQSELRKINLTLPPLDEQRAMAQVLGALDDKIELSRRMNETLEALAQSLFKSWFVDATQSALPKGWREESLDQVVKFLNGLALQKFPAIGDNSLPVIKIAQLRAGNTDGADQASSQVPAEYVIEDGDVIFSWSGSLEVELWCGGRGALNQHLFKVSSKQFPKWFYFLWTRHHLPEFQAIAADKATTMGHIQRKHLTQAKVFVPPPPELKKMSETMSPLIEKLIANKLESRTLAALRDALLPKLLSGELRVPAAAPLVEARA